MDVSVPRVFHFEGFSLDESRCSLSSEGHEIELRPKTFDVLRLLVENAGRLLSKDEILRAVWPNVIVTEDSLVRCVHEARAALGDDRQRMIRTLPRRGYLFDALVSASEQKPIAYEQGERAPALPDRSALPPAGAGLLADRRIWLAALVCIVLAAAAAGIVRFAGQTAAISDTPSIAVLPFANLSRDPEQDYLSDGIAEDLITNLSSFPELVVSARNSSFAYRGKSVRASQIGRDLGVRYLLHGSVHRDREQLRIMVQLVDAPSERQVWAKQYDRPFAAVFALQDAITQEILGSLVSNVRVADVNRMMPVPADDLSAYELVLRAREASFRTATRGSNIEARALAALAVEADPTYAPAHVELGRTYYRAFALEWEGASALDLARESARRAMSLDQRSASAHELLGRIHLRRGQHETAIATLEMALALNVNRADSYASLADALTFAGRAEEAVPLLEKAMRLDPHYLPQLDMYLGRALYFLKRYPRAQMMLETCVARAPGFRPCYMYLAPVYAELGRIDEARRVAAELLKLSPHFTVERSVRRHLPFVEGPMQQFAEGLLKAGVPER